MWLGDSLREFLAWWYQQLRDIVPLRWRTLTRARLNGLHVDVKSLVPGKPPEDSLTLRRNNRARLTLSGQSLAAPKLIAALSGDPAISNPSFIAPVTRSEDGRADLFSIRAELAP